MPPRKTQESSGLSSTPPAGQVSSSNGQAETQEDEAGARPSGKKRKQATESETQPNKATRRSGRATAKRVAPASVESVLKFLLSDEALQYCQPSVENETKNESAKADKSSLRLYTTHATKLNPFEELISAAIFSRPISHRLGHRTIRTVLNAPYRFTSAKAVHEAGREKVSQAIWDAKTQHKEKTAQEIWDIANTVLDEYADATADEEGKTLEGLRKKAGQDMENERGELQKIKGIGKTGLDIFFRRIQWSWDDAYPFIDDRTGKALESLSLPSAAQELDVFLEKNGYDGEEKRREFVIVLERAVGASLEGSAEALMEHAGR